MSRHPLLKQKSWSPDSGRDEAWIRRRRAAGRRAAGRSVTDEDLDELRGCIDLGFGFDEFASPPAKRLADTLPALDLFYAVRRNYHDSVAGSSPSSSSSSSDGGGGGGSPLSIFYQGDSPDEVKARLKQWAQVVACSVRQNR